MIMNSTQWSMWFIEQRVEIHNLLIRCLEEAPNQEAQIVALYEHDRTLHIIAKYAQKRMVRADLVTVLAQRAATL